MTITTTDTPDADALRVAIDRQMLDYDHAIPCIVESVSANGTTVDVIAAVRKASNIDGTMRPLPNRVVRGVPIALYGSTSAGLFVCPPIRKGDDGILFASDRALDLWQDGSGAQMPPDMATPRHNDFTDGIFYPGAQRRSSVIGNFPTDAITVQDRSGNSLISLKDGEIKLMVGENSITIDETGVKINGIITSESGTINITGNISTDGTIQSTGNMFAPDFIET